MMYLNIDWQLRARRLRFAPAWLTVAALASACASADVQATSASTALEVPRVDVRASSHHRQVLYLVMTDRFDDGDPTNNRSGDPSCFDPNDPQKFHGGDLQGISRRLDYLRDLGVTTVWATPLAKQIGRLGPRCGYHGYWMDPGDAGDVSLEPELGDAASLDALLSEAHARSMRFVIDMVDNHTGDTARLPKEHPTWFHDARSCARLGNPEVYCPLDGHPDFVQESREVADYLVGRDRAWVQRFPLDGIRMDTVKHVPNAFFRDAWVPAMRGARDGMFLVGEVFDESGARALAPALDAGFDSVFNFPRRRALVSSYGKGGSLDAVAASVADDIRTLGIDRALSLTSMLDNHDVPRFVNEPGLSVDEVTIAARYRGALAALVTLPGIPQIYYGDEIGLYGGGDPDNRRDMPKWAFTDEGRSTAHPGLAVGKSRATFDALRKLLEVRRATPALYDGGYAELWRPNGGRANVLAFVRATATSRVLVVLNAGERASLSIPLQTNAALGPAEREAFADGRALDDALGFGAPASLTPANGALRIDVPARTAAIYVPR